MKPENRPAHFDPAWVSRRAKEYQAAESRAGREVSFGEAITHAMRQLRGGMMIRNAEGIRVGFDVEKFRRVVAEYKKHERQSRGMHRG